MFVLRIMFVLLVLILACHVLRLLVCLRGNLGPGSLGNNNSFPSEWVASGANHVLNPHDQVFLKPKPR